MKHLIVVAVLVIIVTAGLIYALSVIQLFPESASRQATPIDFLFNLEFLYGREFLKFLAKYHKIRIKERLNGGLITLFLIIKKEIIKKENNLKWIVIVSNHYLY